MGFGNFLDSPLLSSCLHVKAAAMPSRRHEPLPLWVPLVFGAVMAAILLSGKTASKGATPFGEARSTDEPPALQIAHASEVGRGREAISPAQIPWRGWKDIFFRS